MDKNTLDSIYKLQMLDVYHYLLYLCKDKYLAEDLLQDTFFRAYLYLEDCPTENVKQWLFRVAYNAFIDSQRKSKRSVALDDEMLNNIQDAADTEKEILIKEQLSLVQGIMKNLPDKQRAALKLCVFKGLPYKEAAEIMGVSLSYIKILVFRARQTLKENIERMDYLSEDFKEKLKAYTEGRLSEEDKLHMDKELEKLEQYQEFLDEQCDTNSLKERDFHDGIIRNQEKIIKKSKWKARLQNACITVTILSILLIISMTLTSRYYKFGNPSKITLYMNAMRAAIQTTMPNTGMYGTTFRAGTFFSCEIGIKYPKEVGREHIREGDMTIKFNFNKPGVITDNTPNSHYFSPVLHKNENVSLPLDSIAWSTLEKLPEGTVAEAYITFNKLYETDGVLDMFRNKNMKLLWLAVDTGYRENGLNTVLGFPNTQAFPELRKAWFSPTPAGIKPYENGKFRNEYFIDTLKFLKEYKGIVKAIDSDSDIPGALDYVSKNGVKIIGVAITGPTKEILNLREGNIAGSIIVGERRLWNWD